MIAINFFTISMIFFRCFMWFWRLLQSSMFVLPSHKQIASVHEPIYPWWRSLPSFAEILERNDRWDCCWSLRPSLSRHHILWPCNLGFWLTRSNHRMCHCEDEYFALVILFSLVSISECSCSRFFDDSQDVHSSNLACIHCRLALSIVIIRRNYDDRILDWLAQIILSDFLHLFQDHRTDLFW